MTPAYVVPGCNAEAPVLDVEHASLRIVTPDTRFARYCPTCKEGLLCVPRSAKTLQLEEHDRCLLCAQRVRYTDIRELRRKEL